MMRPSRCELPRGRARMIALVIVAASLGGCASGDFGRTRDFARSDDMHRWIGKEANKSSGLRASDFQLTESERQLRDYAYPFIEPPLSRPAWKSVFGEYATIDPPWTQTVRFDRTAYGKMLIDEPHRSHASRYALLMDDVRNDMTRLEPVFQIAARVADLDAKRNASLSLVSEISPKEAADARARMAENALIVRWVQICLRQRVASYRYALERLVIHAPDPVAADADRLIEKLASLVGGAGGPAVAVESRPAVVSKG